MSKEQDPPEEGLSDRDPSELLGPESSDSSTIGTEDNLEVSSDLNAVSVTQATSEVLSDSGEEAKRFDWVEPVQPPDDQEANEIINHEITPLSDEMFNLAYKDYTGEDVEMGEECKFNFNLDDEKEWKFFKF